MSNIGHSIFDQPIPIRAERVNNVKKRDYFNPACKVLEALRDKYADEGAENIEDTKILKVNPFGDIGTPMEIVSLFGGKKQYMQAITELEQEIYAA